MQRNQKIFPEKPIQMNQYQRGDLKNKIIFDDMTQISTQIHQIFEQNEENFQNMIQSIEFVGLENKLRIDHLQNLKQKMRQVKTIQKIKFKDTVLTKNHLYLLFQWLKQIGGNNMKIIFNNNKLDSYEVENFINQLIQSNIEFQYFLITNNCGIYKGDILKKLKYRLRQLNNKEIQFKQEIIKEKKYFNLALIKFDFNLQQEKLLQWKQEIKENKLQQLKHYKLKICGNFTEQNSKGMEHLIKLNFNENSIDQIYHLSLSNNINNSIQFSKMCEYISTSKSLLTLELEKCPMLCSSTCIENLMGNRYSKLSLNKINIGQNENILEKGYKTMADNVFLTCQEIDQNRSLPQQLGTLYKLFVLTEAFEQQNEQLRKDYEVLLKDNEQIKELKKQNQKNIDIGKVENYNRHDLVFKYLQAVIFTETSQVKKFTCQNLDVGRANAYIDSIINFKDKMAELSQKYPIFNDFKLKLKQFTLPEQSYRMEVPTIKRFFQEFFFTRIGDILEIEEFNMIKCFKQNNREEGLRENCLEILQNINQNPDARYSIKRVSICDTTYNFDLETFRCLILTDCFNIEELKIEQDSINGEFGNYTQATINYLQTKPQNYVLPLKSLTLNSIENCTFNVFDLIDFFIFYHQDGIQKIQMHKLQLSNILIYYSASSQYQFEQKLKLLNKNFISSLQELKIDSFQKKIGIQQFIIYVVLSPFVRLRKLSLGNFDFSGIVDQVQNSVQQNIESLQQLEELELSQIICQNGQDWYIFWKIFLFFNENRVKILTLKEIIIDNQFTNGFISALSTIQQINLKQIKLIKCKLQDNILIPLFQCKIECLHFIECSGFDEFLYNCSNEYYQQNTFQLNQCQISNFKIKNCEIIHEKSFKWLINSIILNPEKQYLKKLSLIDCHLSSEMIRILTNQIRLLRDNLQYKKTFVLEKINLSDNPNISDIVWIEFFNSIMMKQQHQQINKLQLKKQKQFDIIEQVEKFKFETSEFIEKDDLGLKQKILMDYKYFCPQFPIQLEQLSLQMEFKDFSQIQKNIFYERIISSLILHPNSKLKDLKLKFLDLKLFMEKCKQASCFLQKFSIQCLKYQQQSVLTSLEQLKIEKVQNFDSNSIEEFVKMFICTNQNQLKTLHLEDFSSIIVSNLLDQLNNKNQYQIKELKICILEDLLDQQHIQALFNDIIFGKVLQVETLKLYGFTFDKIENIQKYQLKHHHISLKQISFNIKSEKALIIFINAIGQILNQEYPLEELEIKCIDIEASLNLFKMLNQETKNIEFITIKKLYIDGKVLFDEQFIIFFMKIYHSLEKISFGLLINKITIDVKQQINQFLSKKNIQKKNSLQIEIKEAINDESLRDYFDSFIFHPKLTTNLILKNYKNFSMLSCQRPFTNIKIIKLDMGLLYNSNVRLNDQSLQLLGSKFIYNTKSQLEELYLYQCQLKLEQIQQLTQSAQEFKQQATPNQTQLNLKIVGLYYSLYVGEQGCKLLADNLFFFEYINIERIDFLVVNFNNEMCTHFINAAQNWIKFQQDNNRKFQQLYPLKYLDIGRNEFVQNKEVWKQLLQTLVFTDKTPYLETLNIQFMSFNDTTTQYLVEQAQHFLSQKPDNYRMPLKKINFSQNNALTHIGWKNIFDNFFLHPKIELIELNMISTMLDSQIKLDTIQDCIKNRALQSPNKKLPLQIFLCYNVSLKNSIYEYLQPKPENYAKPENLPVEIDYDSGKYGIYDGIPEEFGANVRLLNLLFYHRKEFIETSKWRNFDFIRFPLYHLTFHQHYLQVVLETLKKQQKPNKIYLNLKTLDQMCQYFKYTIQQNSTIYPYRLIFCEELFNYLKQNQIEFTELSLIHVSFPSLELINQLDILDIWKQIKQFEFPLQRVELEYNLNDDLIEKMLKEGYDELEILELINFIPPAQIRIENSLSLNALLALYCIISEVYYFRNCSVSYNFDNSLNMGIGFQIRESFYNYTSKSLVIQGIKKKLAPLFDNFISNSITFNSEKIRIQLEKELNQENNIFIYLFIFHLCQLLFIHILPFFNEILQLNNFIYLNLEKVYILFCILQIIMDILLIRKLHLFKINPLYPTANALIVNILEFVQLNGILQIYKQNIFIFIIGMLIYLIFFIQQAYISFSILKKKKKNEKDNIFQGQLTQLYQLSYNSRCEMTSTYVNTINPFNLITLNKFMSSIFVKFQIQQWNYKSINLHQYNNFIKLILFYIPLLFLNLILIIIQLISSEGSYEIFLTICAQFFIICQSVIIICKYQPQRITQEKFDQVINENEEMYLQRKLNYLKEERKQLQFFYSLNRMTQKN